MVCVDSVACAKNYRPESQLVWLIVNQFKSMEDMMRFAKICFGLAFLLPLLTEPSSHGVQDHQLGMFFFPWPPWPCLFFHLLVTLAYVQGGVINCQKMIHNSQCEVSFCLACRGETPKL